MRRPRLVATLLLCLVATGVAAALKHRPPVLPLGECSEVYRQCVGADGIEASYIHGRRFDDSTRLDMTVLHADDSAAWVRLLSDLGFSDEWITFHSPHADDQSPHLLTGFSVRGHPSRVAAISDSSIDYLTIQWSTYELTLFHIDSREQGMIVLNYMFQKVFH